MKNTEYSLERDWIPVFVKEDFQPLKRERTNLEVGWDLN